MATRQEPSTTPSRRVRRLAAAFEPAPRGRLARAVHGTKAVLIALGLCLGLLLAAELHLDGALGFGLRAVVAVALTACLGLAVFRLRARIALSDALRRGLDAIGEGIVLIEPASQRIVYASPACAAVYNRPVDQLVGLNARELALPGDRRMVDERARLRAAGHRVPQRTTLPLAHPGPDPRFAEWATVPLAVEGRGLLLAIARDVTGRELTRTARADDHAFLEAVLDTAAGPIVVVAPDARLLRVNAAAARLAGMEPAELLGRTPSELGLMSEGEAAEVAAALRKGRDPHRHSTAWRTRAGTERVVTWSATAMRDAQGKISSAVSVGLDLTELRAAEERARRAHAALDLRSHELERSNRDLAQLAQLASRDLRDSVRAVTGFGDLLEAHAAPVLDARAHSYLAAMQDAAGGLEELLDGLATYGRLGRGEAIASDVDCGRTLDAVLEELAEEIDARGAAITHDPLPVVPGDPEELASLLSNLVANALRFGGEQRPAVHIGAQRRGLGWELTVSDNGAGVPVAERQRIFQIFRRLHPRGAHRGAGVGLALCQRIVERHGGAIWVDDAAGGGSAFHVTLPDRAAR